MTNYPLSYVDECQKRLRADVKAFEALNSSATLDDKVRERASAAFYNNLVVVFDAYFVHRLRANELKDGNALNEVRVLVRSLLENRGRMAEEKSITMKPEDSPLGCHAGDVIALHEKDFIRLVSGFFREIKEKFV